MRPIYRFVVVFVLFAHTLGAQSADTTSRGDKTFLTRRDLLTAGIALGATAVLSIWDDDIAQSAQTSRFQSDRLDTLTTRVSKVQETTLTIAGLATYGIARLVKSDRVADIALHATEAVVLGSLASQLIRGPLGRTRPYVTEGKDQYDFSPGKGFGNFANRAFPSIHTSSSMAVATALVMETHRRKPSATKFVAPVLFSLGILPGLARIQQNQHWASDIAAGAFMGVLSGYKVVSYSHDHPNNKFDRALLHVTVSKAPSGQVMLGFSPF